MLISCLVNYHTHNKEEAWADGMSFLVCKDLAFIIPRLTVYNMPEVVEVGSAELTFSTFLWICFRFR